MLQRIEFTEHPHFLSHKHSHELVLRSMGMNGIPDVGRSEDELVLRWVHVQRGKLRFVCFAKQDPGRARQNS